MRNPQSPSVTAPLKGSRSKRLPFKGGAPKGQRVFVLYSHRELVGNVLGTAVGSARFQIAIGAVAADAFQVCRDALIGQLFHDLVHGRRQDVVGVVENRCFVPLGAAGAVRFQRIVSAVISVDRQVIPAFRVDFIVVIPVIRMELAPIPLADDGDDDDVGIIRCGQLAHRIDIDHVRRDELCRLDAIPVGNAKGFL